MRQVNRDELVHTLQAGMRDWTKTMLKDLQHYDSERRLRARLIAAGLLADKLKRLEILTDAPEPPGFARIDRNDRAITAEPPR
ncbi:hypothetical protein [Sphingomonas lycopersici]|uniref:Uncharacterized protein n=1 Tax=Sphingomonas lycopersici TaxID=2951807 RepID=A0AA41ZBL2_9SPHN|nr:hypothetical protein [Sphingomonas lycopersici]MCW6536307.1 hypothetical protein [Sphingomonas lycopersici]